MNNCVLSGNLVRDPETRSFANGGAVTRFGIAVNNKRKNKATGEYENEPAFLDFDAWGKQGELIAEHFHKGDHILVNASVKQDNWEDAEGKKRSKLLFTVNSFDFPPGGLKSRGEKTAPAKNEPSGTDEIPDESSIPF